MNIQWKKDSYSLREDSTIYMNMPHIKDFRNELSDNALRKNKRPYKKKTTKYFILLQGQPGDDGYKGQTGMPGQTGPTGDRGAPGNPGPEGKRVCDNDCPDVKIVVSWRKKSIELF